MRKVIGTSASALPLSTVTSTTLGFASQTLPTTNGSWTLEAPLLCLVT